MASSARTTACTTAPTRIAGGNRPGKRPPIAYPPHGAPAASASWNPTTTAVARA